MQPRLVEVRQNILKKNDLVARALRTRFRDAGVFAVSLVSSPGSGKTSFLQRTLEVVIAGGHLAAALVGDLATDNDARRLAKSGAPVRQIITGSVCHLEAQMIEHALTGWTLKNLDFIFIENVGNLVCPANYDLGEERRIVLFSVTEGEDKPCKYPSIFQTADLAIISKFDLAHVAEFDRDKARAAINSVRPGMPIMEVSTRSGIGFQDWVWQLEEWRAEALRLREIHNVSGGLSNNKGESPARHFG